MHGIEADFFLVPGPAVRGCDLAGAGDLDPINKAFDHDRMEVDSITVYRIAGLGPDNP